MTTPDRWHRIKELFDRVVDLDIAAREEVLLRECAGDAALRAEVLSLLRADDDTGEFLEKPAAALLGLLPTDASSGTITRIGVYRITRVIGAGGMGVVYEAQRDDDQFHRRVAIKLIKRGMDSELILRRFRQERQILAALNHPNIASLLDGGMTPDGQPYLVMEFVDGQPINTYVSTRQLSPRAILELFRYVCAAVHFAHQNLIVHRDLKPSNVMVTPDGTVKLLDFGVAKLLRTDFDITAPVTEAADRVLTPAYASPEQLRGEPVTTASDVYSLGVILYELLAGRRPFDFDISSLEELARVVSEEVPSKPSEVASQSSVGGRPDVMERRLHPRLAGELDNIVLMAMRKEPARRYDSAAALHDDIVRYLDGRPIMAQPDSAGYRIRKFAARHRAMSIAALLLLLTLGAGITATLWQARQAVMARDVAEDRLHNMHALARTLIFDVHNAIVDLPGSTPVRELVVSRALQYLDTIAAQSTGNPTLLRDVADAFIQLGVVRSSPVGSSTGDISSGRTLLNKARGIAASIVADDSTDLPARRTLALAHEKLGDIFAWMGQMDSAVASGREALAGFQFLADAQPDNRNAQLSAAISHLKLGDLLGNPHYPNAGMVTEALDEYEIARRILESPPLAGSSDANVRRHVALIHERLGSLQRVAADWDAALRSFNRSLATAELLSSEMPTSVRYRRDIAVQLQNLCEVKRALDRHDEASVDCARARGIYEKLYEADAHNAQAIDDMARIHASFALLHADAGRSAQAVEALHAIIRMRDELFSIQPDNTTNRKFLARALLDLVPHYAQLSRDGALGAAYARNQAQSSFDRASGLLQDLGDSADEQELMRSVAEVLQGMGGA